MFKLPRRNAFRISLSRYSASLQKLWFRTRDQVATPLRGAWGRVQTIVPVRILLYLGITIALLIGLQVWMNLRLSSSALTASESAVHRTIAQTFADRLRRMAPASNREQLFAHIRELASLNPAVRIYLVNELGIVQASPEGYGKVQLPFVDIRPIKRFIARSKVSDEIVLGDDPHALREQKPISTAPIKINTTPHYVYVVLGDSDLQSAFSRAAALSVGTNTAILALITVAILGGFLLIVINTKLHGVSSSLASISHDLRGPLTSVQGYLETLLERGSKIDRAASEKYMSVALKNAKSMAGMVNDLHDLAKLDASGAKVEMEPFSMADIVMDVVMSLKPQFDEKGIKLSTHVPEILPLVRGNIPLIERMFRNLVENALRYTQDEGAVSVTVLPLPGKVRITVTDTGCGIPEHELEKVQSQFYRGERARFLANGSGVGLSVAKRVAELHGGTLTLLSREDEGTAAVFELPHHIGRSNGSQRRECPSQR